MADSLTYLAPVDSAILTPSTISVQFSGVTTQPMPSRQEEWLALIQPARLATFLSMVSQWSGGQLRILAYVSGVPASTDTRTQEKAGRMVAFRLADILTPLVTRAHLRPRLRARLKMASWSLWTVGSPPPVNWAARTP